MEIDFKLDQHKTFEVENENIKGLLLTLIPLDSNGDLVEEFSLNKATVNFSIENDNTKNSVQIYNGFLGTFLNILKSQDPRYDIDVTVVDNSFQIFIPFMANNSIFGLPLKDNLKLKAQFYIPSSTFYGDAVSNSSFHIETVPTTIENPYSIIPTYHTFPIETGSSNATENLGTSLVTAILHIDDENDYNASSNSKPLSISFEGQLPSKKYNKTVSVRQVLNQNRQMLANNPETKLRNLILYRGEAISEAKTKIQFANPSSAGQLLSVTRLEKFN